MTALDFKNNNSFTVWACNHLSISEDAQGNPIVSVPDANGTWNNVTCLESKTNIVPVSCSCGKHSCRHIDVVRSFYGKLYKTEEKAAVKEAERVIKASSIEQAAIKRAASKPKNQGFSILR